MLARLAFAMLALTALWRTPAAARSAAPDNLRARLDAPVHGYNLVGRNFADALVRVASRYRIPMGIVWAMTPAAMAPLALSWKSATVREVIQGVVKTQPGYEMRVASGVVHVYPPNLMPGRENFLAIRIGRFEVHSVPVELAKRELWEQIRLRIYPPRKGPPVRGGIGGSGASNVGDPEISVQLRNATVEDILDALAVASARKIWIVPFPASPTLTPTGFRRTLGARNHSALPDGEQPAWDMLHWGDEIPGALVEKK